MKALVFSKELHGLKTYSDAGGIVGHVDEFYFDDRSWSVRYLVLDVGHWLKDRKVLISPVALRGIDLREARIRTNATAEQIERSPDASTDLPVARALELQIHRHYGWGVTWPESFMGAHDDPTVIDREKHDPHLRSTRVLTGTTIVSPTGDVVGTISDFLIDTKSWRIELVAAECDKFHAVLLDPASIQEIDVTRRVVRVDQTNA
jgi:sporulation protein YlmC with PRC-barrel domain